MARNPDISAILRSKMQEIVRLQQRVLPIKVGAMAKAFFMDNFRMGGFMDRNLKKWPKTRRQESGGPDAAYGPLLSSRAHLSNSVEYRPERGKVYIENKVPYASIHNEGGDIPVTSRMKRFFWASFFAAGGKPKGAEPSPEAKKWRAMALNKKQKIQMPKRQFIGESRAPNKKINALIEKEINALFK